MFQSLIRNKRYVGYALLFIIVFGLLLYIIIDLSKKSGYRCRDSCKPGNVCDTGELGCYDSQYECNNSNPQPGLSGYRCANSCKQECSCSPGELGCYDTEGDCNANCKLHINGYRCKDSCKEGKACNTSDSGCYVTEGDCIANCKLNGYRCTDSCKEGKACNTGESGCYVREADCNANCCLTTGNPFDAGSQCTKPCCNYTCFDGKSKSYYCSDKKCDTPPPEPLCCPNCGKCNDSLCSKPPTSISPHKIIFLPMSIVSYSDYNWDNYYKGGDKFGLKICYIGESDDDKPPILQQENKYFLKTLGSPINWLYNDKIKSVQPGWQNYRYSFTYVSVPFGQTSTFVFTNRNGQKLTMSVVIPEKGGNGINNGFQHVGDPAVSRDKNHGNTCECSLSRFAKTFQDSKDLKTQDFTLITFGGDNFYSSQGPDGYLAWRQMAIPPSCDNPITDQNSFITWLNSKLNIVAIGNHDYDTCSPQGDQINGVFTLTKCGGPNSNYFFDGAAGVYQFSGYEGYQNPLLIYQSGTLSVNPDPPLPFTNTKIEVPQPLDYKYTFGCFVNGRFGIIIWDNCSDYNGKPDLDKAIGQAFKRFQTLGVKNVMVISHFNQRGDGSLNTTEEFFNYVRSLNETDLVVSYIRNHSHAPTSDNAEGGGFMFDLSSGGWVSDGSGHQQCDPTVGGTLFRDADIVIGGDNPNPKMIYFTNSKENSLGFPDCSMVSTQMNNPKVEQLQKYELGLHSICGHHKIPDEPRFGNDCKRESSIFWKKILQQLGYDRSTKKVSSKLVNKYGLTSKFPKKFTY